MDKTETMKIWSNGHNTETIAGICAFAAAMEIAKLYDHDGCQCHMCILRRSYIELWEAAKALDTVPHYEFNAAMAALRKLVEPG